MKSCTQYEMKENQINILTKTIFTINDRVEYEDVAGQLRIYYGIFERELMTSSVVCFRRKEDCKIAM